MQGSCALCSIVEINELVILIPTLVIHAQLNNSSSGQKIQTIEQHLNLTGTYLQYRITDSPTELLVSASLKFSLIVLRF